MKSRSCSTSAPRGATKDQRRFGSYRLLAPNQRRGPLGRPAPSPSEAEQRVARRRELVEAGDSAPPRSRTPDRVSKLARVRAPRRARRAVGERRDRRSDRTGRAPRLASARIASEARMRGRAARPGCPGGARRARRPRPAPRECARAVRRPWRVHVWAPLSSSAIASRTGSAGDPGSAGASHSSTCRENFHRLSASLSVRCSPRRRYAQDGCGPAISRLTTVRTKRIRTSARSARSAAAFIGMRSSA
jgi:hypothetical protein